MGWQQQDIRTRYRKILRGIQKLKTWQLIILLLLGMLSSATLLRLNSLGMNERRTAVINADKSGDEEALRSAIVDLQHYVTHHMNTNLGNGFFLSETYARDRDAALEAANGSSNPNSDVYQQASVECRTRWQGGRESFRNDYVQCVIERVGALAPQGDTASALNLPKADAYRINFVSPIWSFDLAGLSVAFCVSIVAIILGRFISILILRALIRYHYRSV